MTPNEEAASDYIKGFRALYDHVDYFTINVSSPNTPGLRGLQELGSLIEIFDGIAAVENEFGKNRPVFLKIAPDMDFEQLDGIVDLCLEKGLSGIIATNTTISREGLRTNRQIIESIGSGGLSGKPLTDRSTEFVRRIRQRAGNQLAIIAVGGIMTVDNARAKLEAGADLVQVYTGFIYGGPSLIKELSRL